jgi:protease YdgD
MLKSILTLLTSIICLNSYAFNVIGEDDRVAQKSSEYPYVTIGKFSAHIKGLKWAACTATLISENHIITNSHCVYQDGRKLEIEKMEFHVNVVDYFPKESVGIKRVYTPKENFKYRENRYLDWAILELKKPLGKKYGYIRPAAPNYAEDLTKGTHFLAGYSGDFESAHNAGIHKDCNLVEYNDFYLHHECDSGSGASGSSVIREENGSYSVVGLHNSGGPDKNTAISNRRFFDFYMFLVYGDHKEQVDFS